MMSRSDHTVLKMSNHSGNEVAIGEWEERVTTTTDPPHTPYFLPAHRRAREGGVGPRHDGGLESDKTPKSRQMIAGSTLDPTASPHESSCLNSGSLRDEVMKMYWRAVHNTGRAVHILG